MINLKIKIAGSLIIALIITLFISKTLFLSNSPRTNKQFIAKMLQNVFATPTPAPSPTPSPTPIIIITKTPTRAIPLPKATPVPTKKPSAIPTKIIITPYIFPTISKQPAPTSAITTGCITSSSQQYASYRAERSKDDLIFGDPATSPEINLRLRGFGPVNEGTGFLSRGGSTYGLDDQKPPQISSLYGGPVPQIAKTYIVYEWDFENNKSNAPNPATPNYKVTMLGLDAKPGQSLKGLVAGRKINENGDVFMVLYATDKDIVFTHSPSDTLLGGYLFMFLDICVDPNLLAKYQADNAGGRNELPVIGTGQIFGYAGNTDVKVVVRDTMSFMDTRYSEDWWEYGK